MIGSWVPWDYPFCPSRIPFAHAAIYVNKLASDDGELMGVTNMADALLQC